MKKVSVNRLKGGVLLDISTEEAEFGSVEEESLIPLQVTQTRCIACSQGRN